MPKPDALTDQQPDRLDLPGDVARDLLRALNRCGYPMSPLMWSNVGDDASGNRQASVEHRDLHRAACAFATALSSAPAPSKEVNRDTPLTVDFENVLPGGSVDACSYSDIEFALDRADAPSRDEHGKWLTLPERIARLSTQPPAVPPPGLEALRPLSEAADHRDLDRLLVDFAEAFKRGDGPATEAAAAGIRLLSTPQPATSVDWSRWQIVPKNPTSRMKNAGSRSASGSCDIAHDVYALMLEVAPAPPQSTTADRGEG